jgi:acyl-CoA synthetase (NDP forming)
MMQETKLSAKQQMVDKTRFKARTVLTEIEAKELLAQAGIEVIVTRLAKSRGEAIAVSREFGFPVALKIASTDITHKSDISGVKLGLETAKQVGDAYGDILAAVKRHHPQAIIHGVSVQKMACPAVEVVIGMYRDAQFGPVIMFGLGGILVEIIRDVALGIVPLTMKDAREMIREIKGYPLLTGYRGWELVDIAYLEGLLLKISKLFEKMPEIKELEINPLFAYSNGAVAVDARILLEEGGR